MKQSVFSLLLFWFSLNLFANEIERLDLKGAIKYALTHSPTLHSFTQQKEINYLYTLNARSSVFPKVQFSLSSGISTKYPTWPSNWSNGFTFSVNQPVLNNIANGIAIDIARTKTKIGEYELLIQRDRLCMKVAKEYYAYQAAILQQQIIKQKLKLLNKQLDLVNARFRQGLKRERDVLRFRAQVQQTRIQEVAAVNRMEQARNILIATITGINQQELETTFDFVAMTPELNFSRIPTIAPKISNHFLARKFEHERSLVNLDVNLARRQLWPELSVSLSATNSLDLALQKPITFLPAGVFMLGLSLNFEIFDFGKRRREVVIASKNREIKENDISTELATETLAISQMMSSFPLLKDTLSLNKHLLTLEEDNFRRIESDYLQGKAQYLDVIAALNSLSDVKSSFYAALFDLETQLVTHRFYEGSLYDWIL